MTPESVLDPMYKDGNFFEGDLAIRKELIESYYESDDASVSFTTIMCCFEAFIHRRVCFKSMDTAAQDTVETHAVHAKLKFPFRICRTLVVLDLRNVNTEDTLEPCYLHL